jgi:GNAT superfamily N-acetyltransferase
VLSDVVIRPMLVGDVPAVERLTDEGFYELGRRTTPRAWPEVRRRSEADAVSWRRRVEHILRQDPGGCWVAEADGEIVGVAAALRRDLTWILATFVVDPALQGQGVGRQLFDAASTHGGGCLRGMLAATADPRAARRYRQAGFTLHPTMQLTGTVSREALPVVERVREGVIGDVDLMNSVDRQVRDSAHGVDHELLTSLFRFVVIDRSTGSGYAYVDPSGGPYLLAATNRRTATDLLWEALAASGPGVRCTIGRVTAVNEWAVDVGMAARLDLYHHGYLALRHMKPPMPYLPSGHFL